MNEYSDLVQCRCEVELLKGAISFTFKIPILLFIRLNILFNLYSNIN